MKRNLLAAIFLAAATTLAWATLAGAVDGTIEINQAKVLAGSGFPYVISSPGSYRLTGNLTVSGMHDGIDVNASGVTVDLNGFSISGPGTGANTDGINVGVAASAVTVKNGMVTSVTYGAFLGVGVRAAGIHASGDNIGIAAGTNSTIENCVAISNVSDRIECLGGGNCAISGNSANSNLSAGINCAAGCAISHNTANSNGGYGILCNAAGCVISGNTMDGDNSALLVNGASLVIQNTMENNNVFGFAGTSTDGYGENVMNWNGGGNVSGGKSMGNDVRSGVLC
jgi:hypothetical protein